MSTRAHPGGLRRCSTLALAIAALVAALAAAPLAGAATLSTELIASGLNAPIFATAPLADGRVFVASKDGSIQVVQGGVVSDFLSIPVDTAGERGLLGLAFDPMYGTAGAAGQGRFFVNYIDPSTHDTVVASYRTSAANASLADPASRMEVMRIAQPPGRDNHKAGWLGFKPGDASHLYIATGDGGSANDPDNNAQNRSSLLGKLLRVDVTRDDFADPAVNYGIPLDNPWVGVAGARPEIFATGLRNPFRNGFDSQNGNLWIADVGQGLREELNLIAGGSAGGQNFGWRIREGDIATPGISDPNPGGLTGPVLTYDHSAGASIIGGVVVRDPSSPLNGQYLFGDFISGRIWAIAADGRPQTLAQATDLTAVLNSGPAGQLGHIVSFDDGAAGLLLVDYNGQVLRVTTAVPEPASWVLALAGIGGLAWRLRRRG